MTHWRKSIRDLLELLIVVCVPTLFLMLLVVVLGLADLGGPAGIIIQVAGLILIISLGMDWVFHYYSEEIRESKQEDEKQVLFKPTVGMLIFFMIFTFIPAFDIIYSLIKNKAEFDLTFSTFSSILLLVLFTWLWYLQPVFIFTEDSVQIKSFLFYFFRIDRKTVIRYADIISVGPNMKGNYGWGVEPMHSVMISMNGTTHGYGLACFDYETVAKIWLRFREKLGDKVRDYPYRRSFLDYLFGKKI